MTPIDSTMLVRLKLRQCSFEKMDRKVTKDVLDREAAGKDAGKFTKRLIPTAAIRPVNTAIGHLRTANKSQTLPFDDSHWRLLTTANWDNHNRVMNDLGMKLVAEVENLLNHYPRWKASAQQMLNGMYKEEDYPTPDEIREMFKMEVKYREVPRGSNFLVDMNDDRTKAIRESIEQETADKFASAQKELWDKMLETVSHFTEMVGAGDREHKNKDGKIEYRTPVFKNSVVENLAEIADLAPRLNLTGDRQLNELATAISAELLEYTPEQLRQSSAARNQVAEKGKAKVDAITKAMEGVF